MPNFGKNIFIWLIIGVLLVAMFSMFQGGMEHGGFTRLAFSDFLEKVDQGQVGDVVIRSTAGKGSVITGHTSDGTAFFTQSPDYPNLVDKLSAKNVKISAVSEEGKMDSFWSVLLSWFPILLLVGVYIFFMRQMQGGGGRGGALGFGKSRARLLTEKTERVTFEDVAGIEEAKDELYEIVDFLKDPHKYQRLGGKIPRGCLLVGPPGTGKTLLARAIAGEAKVPFFTISGSDFVEMFVGVGASRVRDMFEQGKKNAPCIIFIDEIDAVGRHRGAGLGGGNDEREQTLNQLLVEMDGFEANESVIIIAATNRPDVLDPALLRPGRFDRQIVVPNPDMNGRAMILEVHLRKIPKAPDVDSKVIARGTPGFSGADLANIVNEAALLAARMGKKVVTMRELEAAKDKVMMGAERKSLVMSEEEKKMTAYHEGGHALVSIFCPASDPIHKATIIPRGRALGMVMRLPESDKLSYHREKMYADLAVSMGGRVAEEIIFGYEKVSSGASSDIKYATKLARAMVTEWGMSDKIGPIFYGSDQGGEVFLGYSMGQHQAAVSEQMANLIDSEVKRIVQEAHDEAKELLTKHLDALHRIASHLLEYETLTGDEIKTIVDGQEIRRVSPLAAKPAPTKSSLPSSRPKLVTDDQAGGIASGGIGLTMKLFGTDGIRGKANTAPMTADIALKVGMSAGQQFMRGAHRHRVVIAKDTRLSGYMIEPALTSGFIAAGMDVVLVGPMPTPAVAMLVRSLRADLGVMISASHNEYRDNGIKLFGPDGYKLSDEVEAAIEAQVVANRFDTLAAPDKLGRARRLDDAQGRYIEFAKSTFPKRLTLEGIKIVIDCAHGAAYHVAPMILRELGAEVVAIGISPDGTNINHQCGSTAPELVCETVAREKAHIGITLDGDADRVLICDEKGTLADGDQLLAIIATQAKKAGTLRGKSIVATHMSNLGLERYLTGIGLTLERAKIGDRYVVEAMRKNGANIGGEQSGHIILSDYTTTGDGIIAALQVLAYMIDSKRPLSECGKLFTPLPQLLRNVPYEGISPLNNPKVQKAIKDAEISLGKKGRLLIRESGTEPLVRVMAEGEDNIEISALVDSICESVRKAAANG